MAVGEAEVDEEAPTRGAAAPGEAAPGETVFWQSGLCQPAEPTAGGGGGENERVPCSQTQGDPWNLAVHSSLGQLCRPRSTVRKRG